MKRTIIIAEAGVNHNGDMRLAKELIEASAMAGADYVKFQSFKADSLVTKNAEQAKYQKENTKIIESQFNMLKKLELSNANHFELISECNKYNIGFLTSAFDKDGINFIKTLNVDFLKIPSGEITNLPYLKLAATFEKPLILSTGMSTLAEIDKAINILKKYGNDRRDINILHCITEYPAPKELINLNFINTLKKCFGLTVGYSDHTLGIEIAIAAVALGAEIIEKHITLDKDLYGPDHKASLNPKEFKTMVNAIRNVEKSLGSGIKKVTDIEIENARVARKSLVAKSKIMKGEFFTKENVAIKRPGTGISPMRIDEIIGTKSKNSYNPDDILEIKNA